MTGSAFKNYNWEIYTEDDNASSFRIEKIRERNYWILNGQVSSLYLDVVLEKTGVLNDSIDFWMTDSSANSLRYSAF